MMAWMLYALFVAGLLTAAAAVAEWVVRGVGGGARWVWIAAGVASLILPTVMGLGAGPGAAATGHASIPVLPGGSAMAEAGGWTALVEAGDRLQPVIVTAWAGASAVLLLLLITGVVVMWRRTRRWPRVRLMQEEVFLSDGFGPALVGGLRGRVVLPRWALRLGRGAVAMILIHEEEHRRAGDVPLLLAGAVLVTAAPWNPFLWLQLRRLRGAVETDCDRRVLARGVPPVEYARLLLSVAERTSKRPVAWSALAAHPSLLERRLKMIVGMTRRVNGAAAAGAGLLAVSLVFLACETDAPPLTPDARQDVARAEFQAQEEVVSGGTGAGPLIFVDGERVAREALDGIEPETIDRIEVVKGAAAEALLGEEAAAGVIRIFLKRGASESSGTYEGVEVF